MELIVTVIETRHRYIYISFNLCNYIFIYYVIIIF